MHKYECMKVIGEGSYGLVLKCRHSDSNQVVAIKKLLQTEEDATIRKMALREIRMVKRLKHENLVAVIEVFRYKKRFYIVFEYVNGTILDELEKNCNGFSREKCKELIYQIVRGVNYCHQNHIIHRDIKPENILVSSLGVVKLCDFGFARLVTFVGEHCTEHVATRWYRAPELLLHESQYGGEVDIWAIGCVFAEIMTGAPLFPGDTEIDQIYKIVQLVGDLCPKHREMILDKPHFCTTLPTASMTLEVQFSHWPIFAINFLKNCLKMNPCKRATTQKLLESSYFTYDDFPKRFLPELRKRVNFEFNNNSLLEKQKSEIIMSTDKANEQKFIELKTEIRWNSNFSNKAGNMSGVNISSL